MKIIIKHFLPLLGSFAYAMVTSGQLCAMDCAAAASSARAAVASLTDEDFETFFELYRVVQPPFVLKSDIDLEHVRLLGQLLQRFAQNHPELLTPATSPFIRSAPEYKRILQDLIAKRRGVPRAFSPDEQMLCLCLAQSLLAQQKNELLQTATASQGRSTVVFPPAPGAAAASIPVSATRFGKALGWLATQFGYIKDGWTAPSDK